MFCCNLFQLYRGDLNLKTFLPHGMTQDPWMIDCSTVGKRWVNRSTKETILLNALLLQSPRFRKIVHRIATKLPSTSGQFLLFHSIKGTAIRIDCFGLGRRRLSAGVKNCPKRLKRGISFRLSQERQNIKPFCGPTMSSQWDTIVNN